jgi:GntR family transcriptional regulator/MocR family aminotransferase
VGALRRHLAGRVSFDVPPGGIALWVKAKDGIDVEEWAAAAQQQGAMVVTASSYTFDDRPRPYMRLGFAALNSRELEEGVRRLAEARPLAR